MDYRILGTLVAVALTAVAGSIARSQMKGARVRARQAAQRARLAKQLESAKATLPPLPPASAAILRLTAAQLVDAIRARAHTARDVVTTYCWKGM